MLPEALRERGQKLLNQKDELKRTKLTGELLAADPRATLDFILALFATDPAVAVRRVILYELGRRPAVSSNPRFVQTLERCVTTEPDAEVAVSALDKLRAHRMREMRKLLTQRLEAARQKNDDAAFKVLAQDDERWISLVNGTMLPAFMRTPPPLFALKEGSQTVRVFSFGDFGNGAPENHKLAGAEQKQVAAAMLQAHRQTPFDFGLTVGDNFYPDGMESPADERWQTQWRELYDPLGVKIYATLGNHDWHAADSPAAELLYTQQSASWRMPAPYFTFTAGPVQFFALDTNEVSEAQLLWLQAALKQSRARWRVVYGHHPIYSGGQHGVSQILLKRLLPLLEGRADIYLAGHEHDMQHLKPADSQVHFFVNGAGGATIRTTGEKPNSLFALGGTHGFATLEANANTLTVKFIGTDLKTLYEYTLSKNGAP
ncbi:MAG: metallophosphoesterase [Acidobacteria bacterium]|nr:metallophosphoesterase [Acidobacteriota bacterium]MBI3428391.1 metallophosphoesterase [Acidobacteriota bacterium]